MNDKKNMEAWLGYVRDNWVNYRGGPHFRTSVGKLIDKMQGLIREKKFEKAWHCLEQIEKLQIRFREDTRSYPKESPSALLQCGIAAWEMGNSREAIRLLTGSISYFTENYDKAVSRWLLGCIYWDLEDEIEAIATWESSIQEFIEHSKKINKVSEDVQWFNDQISKMQKSLQYKLEEDKQSEGQNSPESQDLTNAQNSPKSQDLPDAQNLLRYTEKNIFRKTNRKTNLSIRSLSVLGEIPAGTPRKIIPVTIEAIEIDRILLADKEYCIESLISGEHIVNLSSEYNYFVLRVVGNSMNQSTPVPIENGNYVILRAQNVAESGDIVAAEIVGVDSRATLKRFKREPRAIFLIPESSAPEFKSPIYVERELRNFDEDFYIRGVAVAVLKPV